MRKESAGKGISDAEWKQNPTGSSLLRSIVKEIFQIHKPVQQMNGFSWYLLSSQNWKIKVVLYAWDPLAFTRLRQEDQEFKSQTVVLGGTERGLEKWLSG